MTLLVGRKAICRFLGGVSWDTVRRWIRDQGLPVVRENGAPPSLLTTHAEEWQRGKLKKMHGGEKR